MIPYKNWLGLGDYFTRSEKIEYLFSCGANFSRDKILDSMLNTLFIYTCCKNIKKTVSESNKPTYYTLKECITNANSARKLSIYKNRRVQIDSLTFAACKKVYFNEYCILEDIIKNNPLGKYLFIEMCEQKYNGRWTPAQKAELKWIEGMVAKLEKPENKEQFNQLLTMIKTNQENYEQHQCWANRNVSFAPRRFEFIDLQKIKKNPLVSDIWHKLKARANGVIDCDTAALANIKEHIQGLLPFIARDDDIQINYNTWNDKEIDTYEMLQTKILNLSDSEEKQKNMKLLETIGRNHVCADLRLNQFLEIRKICIDLNPKLLKLEDEFNSLEKTLNLNDVESRNFSELKIRALCDESLAYGMEQYDRLQQQEKQEKQATGSKDSSQLTLDALSHRIPQKYASYWDKGKIDTLSKLQDRINNETNETNETEFSNTLQKIYANMQNTTDTLGHINYFSGLAVEVKNMCKTLEIPQSEVGNLLSAVVQDESGLLIKKIETPDAQPEKAKVSFLILDEYKNEKPQKNIGLARHSFRSSSRPSSQQNASNWDEESLRIYNLLKDKMNNENNETKYTNTLQQIEKNRELTLKSTGDSDYTTDLAMEVLGMCEKFAIPQSDCMKLLNAVVLDEAGVPTNVMKPSGETAKKATEEFDFLGL